MFRRSSCPSSGHVARCAPEARVCPRLRAVRKRPASAPVCAAATASVRTHYEVLGVRDSASVRDIKDAFRRLALLWHPDRCKQPGAKDKFMELKTAYDTLVDFSARAKYDLQLKQAAQTPPRGLTAAAYDWSNSRGGTSVRRSSSTFRRAPQQPIDGFAAAPPRPPTASSFSGDDFEALNARASSSASSAASSSNPHAAGAARVRAASTSTNTSTPGRTASAQGYPQGVSSTAGGTNGGYRSIFAEPQAPTSAFSRASSSGSGGAGSSFGGSTTTPAANQQAARSTSAFSRSSNRTASRSSSRSRYAQSGSSSTAGSSRPASPTPAQQWHSLYCHSGDDYVAAMGTSYAATAAYASVTAHTGGRENAAGSGTIGSGSSSAAVPWHVGMAAGGDGFSLGSPSPAEADARALPSPANPTRTWPFFASHIASGDDYVPHQPALAGTAPRESLPAPAPPAWNHAQAQTGPARVGHGESSPCAASPAWGQAPAQPAAVRSHERREVQPVSAPPMWDMLSTILPLRM